MSDIELDKQIDEILSEFINSEMEEVPEMLCENIFKMIESEAGESTSASSVMEAIRSLYARTVTAPKKEIDNTIEVIRDSFSPVTGILKLAFAFI